VKLLLDTHALIWLIDDAPMLRAPAREAILGKGNQVYFSVISLCEIALKASVGKLKLTPAARSLLQEDELERKGLLFLPLAKTHAFGVSELPLHHRDPFDRLLVSQALQEGLIIVSHDRQLEAYGVPILWT
jgi:PIN domain nuclease of toxin-antitoxin system